MPIKDKSLYPKDWEERTQDLKEQAGWTCEKCGAVKGEERIGTKRKRSYKVQVQAAHLDHDPQNPYARLMILCQSCHLKHDRFLHGTNARLTKIRNQIQREIDAGQLQFPDFE